MKPSPEQHIQIIVISPNLHIPSTNHLLPAEAEDIVYGQHYLLHLSPLKDENCWTTYIDQSSFKSPTNPKHIQHRHEHIASLTDYMTKSEHKCFE